MVIVIVVFCYKDSLILLLIMSIMGMAIIGIGFLLLLFFNIIASGIAIATIIPSLLLFCY